MSSSDDIMEYQRDRKISVATIDAYKTEFNKVLLLKYIYPTHMYIVYTLYFK